MRRVADKMVDLGLDRLGYRYLNLDDCWAKGRREDGSVYADNATFPSGGLKELADYVHSKGLLLGTYTDRGTKTCAKRPGSAGYEEIDAQTYANWGLDYVKEDSCFAGKDHDVAFNQYSKMRDALNATGRPMLFSICGWSAWYAPVGRSLGNAFRTGPDDKTWGGVLKNIDILPGLEQYAGPGGWNDPCLLRSRSWTGKQQVSELQSRAQFSMWAIIAAPLLISGSLFQMTPHTLETYTNEDVIRVNQDPLGRAGTRIMGGPLAHGASNVWARPLTDGSHALVFINTNSTAVNVTCDRDCFATIGIYPGDRLSVRDLWAASDLPDVTEATLTASALEPHGGHLMVRVTPQFAVHV